MSFEFNLIEKPVSLVLEKFGKKQVKSWLSELKIIFVNCQFVMKIVNFRLKLPTVDNFLNYLPLDIGGYVIGVINLAGNAFASILQLRNTISMNLKEFNGESDTCKNCKEFLILEIDENLVKNSFLSILLQL